MAPGDVNKPNTWLRVWQLVQTKSAAGGQAVQARKLALKPMGKLASPILGGSDPTYGYLLGGASIQQVTRFLIQVRAQGTSIVDTEAPPRLLDADFVGTDLAATDLDNFWQNVTGTKTVTEAAWTDLVDTGRQLPSGDGTEGGLFHGWFEVSRQG
jgi:hypothetical protein